MNVKNISCKHTLCDVVGYHILSLLICFKSEEDSNKTNQYWLAKMKHIKEHQQPWQSILCPVIIAVELVEAWWCFYAYVEWVIVWGYDLASKGTNKQRVLMHRHQGWNVRHGLCHIYMRYIYIYIWVVYSFCLFCCLFIIVTWWYIWCIVWQVASKRKYRHVW